MSKINFNLIKFFFISIISVIFCVNSFSSIPPHPRVDSLIQEGKIALPYHLDKKAEASARGINGTTPFVEGFRPYEVPKGKKSTTFKAIAILVRFSDNPSQVAESYFDNLLYGTSGNTMRTYFTEVSYGQLDIVTVNLPSSIGWLNMPQTYSYYVNGNNGFGSYPQNAQKLTEDAVAAANATVDFSQYDNNSDGYVDALFIIHTGQGAEYTGNPNHIWSHKWQTSTPQLVDGVYAYVYSMEPEYWATPGDMTCGVYAHEAGHSIFGLPDLYDYGRDSRGLGRWSLMASGSWSGTLGSSPAHPDAWSRYAMGFVTPTVVSTNVNDVNIPAVKDNPTIFKLWTNGSSSTEYFLVENRQKIGFDTYLRGDGLCIYHIDETQWGNDNQWYPGYTDYGHYKVALEQADGLWDLEKNINTGDTSDTYPGSTNNTIFSNSTIPNSKDYNFNNTSVSVTNISASGITMTANFSVEVLPPEIEVTPDSMFADLYSGDDTTQILTINNSGLGELAFNIVVEDITTIMKRLSSKPNSSLSSSAPIPLINISKGDVDTRIYPAMTLGSGGPDPYGYRWKDSDEPGGPAFNWMDVSSGTSINLSDDSYITGIPLGFNFNYYGTDYTTVNIMSNGWVSFNGYHFWYPPTVPYIEVFDPYLGCIVPFGKDLYPPTGNYIKYKTFGISPNRYFVVEYNNIPNFGGGENKTFEIIFFEGSNQIKFQYLTAPDDPNSIGIESPDQTMGMGNGGTGDLFISPTVVKNNYAIEFSSQPPWLTATPSSGVVPPSSSVNIDVKFSAIGKDGGEYDANIFIINNDPDEDTVRVPAHMHVTGAPNITLSDTAFDYDTVFIGVASQETLRVSNVGTDVLNVSNITSDQADYTVDITNFGLSPGQSQNVVVTFTPSVVGERVGTLTITSDDPDEGTVTVDLVGVGAEPPNIVITPTTMSSNLFTGEMETQTLTISNTGASNLTYNISLDYFGLASIDKVNVSVKQTLKTPPTNTGFQAKAEYKPNQVIVKFKTEILSTKASSIRSDANATVAKKFSLTRAELWNLSGVTVEDAISRYKDDPSIEYIEPNYVVHAIDKIPNDPFFTQLWGMQKISAPAAWDRTTGTNIVIGVLDTGVDPNHEDLSTNIWTNPGEVAGNGIDDDGNGYIDDVYGWDFFNNDNNPYDDNGHGTHVSGTIAAIGNNGKGVVGVCWSAKIMALKFLSAGGSGYTDGAISAVEYATMMNARLTSNSWGGGGYSQGLYDAIQAAGNAGVLFVAAAGNSSMNTDINPNYPSCYDLGNIISVASTTSDDQMSSFSNYGLLTVDLGAPGSNIYSTLPGNNYGSYSGTSMATPHVAGVAGLVLSLNSHLGGSDVKNIILSSIDPISALAGKTVTGGRLNAFQALQNTQTWINVEPLSGVIPPGSSADLTVTFDATGLYGGDYNANILIISNDPDEDTVSVPAHLHVTGAPDIAFSDTVMDYGNVFLGGASRDTLIVSNVGTDVLTVSNISSDNSDYTVDITSFSLNPRQQQKVIVTFTPTNVGLSEGSLTITGDDPDEPIVTVGLRGVGILPPDIDVKPESLFADLLTGQTRVDTLTIYNNGFSNLNFNISIKTTELLQKHTAINTEINNGNVNQADIRTEQKVNREPTLNETSPTSSTSRAAGVYSGDYLQFGISDYGEIMPFRYPIGNEHLAVGAWISGYTIAYRIGGYDNIRYASYDYRSGIIPLSYTEIVNDPYQVIVKVEARTSDGYLKITRLFTFTRSDKYINVKTTLENVSGLLLEDIVFKSYADWDVDGDYGDDNWNYDMSRNMIYAYDIKYTTIASKQTPDAMDIDGWGDFQSRTTIVNYPTGPVYNYDGLELLHYNLGNIGGGTSKEIINAFGAGENLTDLQSVIDRGLRISDWLAVNPLIGFVSPQDSLKLIVQFDASGLNGGNYYANILISSNDPDEDTVIVPAHLHVTGASDIALSDTSIDFDTVFVSVTHRDTLTVSNVGTDVLNVSDITSDNSDYTVDITSFILNPRQQQKVVVTFTPNNLGLSEGSLTITSDDPDEPIITVGLRGVGVEPPDINVTPDSLFADLLTGQTEAQTLTISNAGASNLHFNISIASASGNKASNCVASYTLPSIKIDALKISGIDKSENDNKSLSHQELYAQNITAQLQDMTGKYIGITNSYYYYVISSDLKNRGATIRNVVFPISTLLLDSLDVLFIDDAISGASTSDLSKIRNWVQAGNALIIQGDNNSSMSNINALLSGTGIQETSLGTFYDAILTNILPHDITRNVDTIAAWAYGSYCTVTLPAQTLVFDNVGRTHVAVSNLGLGKVIAVGNEFSEDWNLSGGDTRLLANQMVDWLVGGCDFLSVVPTSGTIAPGNLMDVSATFDATGMDGGNYYCMLEIYSNDPDEDTVTVPVHLHVTGAPDVSISDTVLNFDSLFIGLSKRDTLIVTNVGTDILNVYSITLDNTDYALDTTHFSLMPRQNQPIIVTFTPNNVGISEGTLTITSNDPDEEILEVDLFGAGTEPPDIAVTPDSLSADLFTGATTTQTLTISNTGTSDLHFNTEINFRILIVLSQEKKAAIGFYADQNRIGSTNQLPHSFIIPDKKSERKLAIGDVLGTYYNFPYANTGIAWVGNDLYVVDWGGSMLRRYNTNTQQVVASYSIHPSPYGIAWDGQYLWIGNGSGNIYGYNLNGNLVGSFSTPFYDYPALAWDGQYFIVNRAFSNSPTFYRINYSGVIIESFSSSYSSIIDQTVWVPSHLDGELWGNNPNNGSILQLKLQSGIASVIQSFPFYDNDFSYTLGHNGTDLWWSDWNGPLFQIDDGIQELRWLSVNPISGTVPASSAVNVDVSFDATGLIGGDYYADIIIKSNDPDENPVIVPTHLHVTGVPDISISIDTLKFGSVYVGTTQTQSLDVFNQGTDTLIVSEVTSNISNYYSHLTNFKVLPGSQRDILVSFTPNTIGSIDGILSFANNDPDEPLVYIYLAGKGITPPVINISPDSMFIKMSIDDSSARILTIENSGGNSLNYSLLILADDSNLKFSSLFSQASTQYTIPLRIEDYVGYSGVVEFGIHPAASYGIDPHLGESEIFPPFPLTFDARLIDLPGRNNLGMGTWRDLRTSITTTQVDTYLVKYQPSENSFPMKLTWQNNLIDYVGRSKLIDTRGGQIVNIDMLSSTSVTITDSEIDSLYIITTGRGILPDWIKVSPTFGTCPPSETHEVTIRVNSKGLNSDIYSAYLKINSNDPVRPSITFPVTLEVKSPIVTVATDSIVINLDQGISTTQTITLGNVGEGDLLFEVVNTFSVPVQKEKLTGDRDIDAQNLLSLIEPPQPGTHAERNLKTLQLIRNSGELIFSDDMESGINGWTTVALTGQDLWHLTQSNYNSPNKSWWCGIASQGNYFNGQRINNALISPPIDLRGRTSATLEFFEYYHTEHNYDRCMVDVSTNDGESWEQLRGDFWNAPSGLSGGWVLSSYQLTPYIGNIVKLRFYFDTGDHYNNRFPGWWIDDVLVHGLGGWLTVNPTSGRVLPNTSIDITANVDATRLYDGEYYANIVINNNDPNNRKKTIPLRLTVNPEKVISLRVASGWNLLSVPLTVEDFRARILFPDASSAAFGFEGRYRDFQTLENGKGYWIKFLSEHTVPIRGIPIIEDTIDVFEKWNIIGSNTYPVAISDLVTVPPLTILSNFFGYKNVSGYFNPDTLVPGNGYWVKFSHAGQIILRSFRPPGLSSPVLTKSINIEDMNYLLIEDADGRKQKLYFAMKSDDINLERYELPPLSPAADFSVRYSSNRNLELLDGNVPQFFPILISNAKYPLKVYWDLQTEISNVAIKFGNQEILLEHNDSTNITNPDLVVKLIVRATVAIPKEFALEQNYPNPFNPTTTIKYALPDEAKVTINIFNILGQKVETLIDDIQSAGYKDIKWNTKSLASGIYYYRLEATSVNNPSQRFIQIRKMILLR
ncbi:MAG: choice-of-anchor D domain-containing protein [Bacteroidota bacterium]|nr:choice-of-anchor D domain-containing protein [Bacteroidota bacterium]